jgi:hypothetical protein
VPASLRLVSFFTHLVRHSGDRFLSHPSHRLGVAARRRRYERRAVLERIDPLLRDAQMAVIQVLSRQLQEADAEGHVQPRGFTPGRSPDVARQWSDGEQSRLVRLWNSLMKGTDAVGVLEAEEKA